MDTWWRPELFPLSMYFQRERERETCSKVTRGLVSEVSKLKLQTIGQQPQMPPYHQNCPFLKNAIMIPYHPALIISLFPHYYPPQIHSNSYHCPTPPIQSIKLLPFPSVCSHKSKRVTQKVRDREKRRRRRRRNQWWVVA